MNADSLLEGEYIKAVELGDKLPANPTYTIKAVDIESLPNLKKPGKDINKGVVYFREIERGWVMNRTNVECLKALFGKETGDWVGRRITLGAEPTKTGPGIRVIGSPEIEREVIAEWTPPRQKKVVKRLVPTGKPQKPATPPVDPDPTLTALRTTAADAVKRGWTMDQVHAIMGATKAAEVPADQREAVTERLKGDPPTPESEPPTDDTNPADNPT